MSENTMPAKIAGALVKAAKAAEAVEKGKRAQMKNRDGEDSFSYAFAGADALMTEAREALGGAGLAIVLSGWRVEFVDRHDWRDGAEVTWTERVVHAAFVLVHEDGETHALGDYSMPSIPGQGRPHDKADASALTYCTGYVMRGLLNLPRVEPGSQVDERDDRGHTPPQAKRAPSAEEKAAALALEVGEALSTVEDLEAWCGTYAGKAVRAIGMERLRPLIAAAAGRLRVEEAAWQSWLAKAAAKMKEAQRGAAVASGQ